MINRVRLAGAVPRLVPLCYVTLHVGWSLLLDVGRMGFDSFIASRSLLEKGKIAAMPMKDWGEHNGDQFVRFVFSNEPVKRLATLKNRIHQALLR
jgi:aspartate/methionine/tyrosine aminotransferase